MHPTCIGGVVATRSPGIAKLEFSASLCCELTGIITPEQENNRSNEVRIRTDDVRRLVVFGHRCLKIMSGFRWRQRVSNEMIRKLVFGCAAGTSIRENI
ncbi:hypothetical protein T265_01563 [Opisthorchis viverrini]|uniref:Uncharacterized protein n=1 Tax=Opisthorchis viverrini TaxID=6198 RepID=A0A075A9C4_OPIVI|nr:hypothetical protein T265_01563 [Opisthorchis viverrini]KER32335.1 hypothetical protein T265_01563 [Opisthorchis viverrini]